MEEQHTTNGLALWRREVGAIGFLFAVVLWFRLEFYLFVFNYFHQHYIINLASAAGAEVFQIPPQRQAVTVVCKPAFRFFSS